MSWEKVELSDIAPAKPLRLVDADAQDRIWQLTLDHIESHSGKLIEKTIKPLHEAGSSTHAFNKDHVLYSKLRPYLNKVYLPNESGICTTELVPMLPDKRRLDKRYLAYYLRSEEFVNWVSAQTAGAKMPRVSMKTFWQHKIPLPPLSIQKQIAALLEKADTLRSQCKQMEQELNQLAQSVFLEMFGDPVSNPKGLRLSSMTDCFDIKTGKLDSNAAVLDGQYPFFTCAKTASAIDVYAFDQEALLLAGNNAQGEYDVKHYSGKFNAYQRTYVLTLQNKSWSYPFFKVALEYQLQNLKRKSKGTNTKYITMGIMNETLLPVPSSKEQEKFVSVYRAIQERGLDKLSENLVMCDGLFDSLMQSAFSGKLNLTKAA